MGLEQATVQEIVDKGVSHRWGIPEFQRGFVWTPQKVRDLIDSLWRGYPVGSFLLWYSGGQVEPRTADDEKLPDAWVVDGQQRTTALCVLTGRKPYWWSSDWNDAMSRHDVRFDVLAETEPFFSLRTAAMKGPAGKRWVSVREILAADDDRLSDIIQRLLVDLNLPGGKFGQFWTRLDSLRKTRDTLIPVVTVTLELEDVTEIFGRLNSAGTKITEADIALALAASHNPGWARENFLPFLDELAEAGFDLDPNLVFRSFVAIGIGRTRLKDVPRSYWSGSELPESWKRTQAAWRAVVHYVEQRGILSADVLPTKNALIPMAIMIDRFNNALRDGDAFAWLLHATRSGRYGGSALTALEQDVRAIHEATAADGAWRRLESNTGAWEPLASGDFMTDYRDRFGRLLLYLIAYDRGARDWLSKQRLGFQGQQLLEKFSPDWHHIFPRAYLRKSEINEDRWDLFANVAVVDPSSNIRFGGKKPPVYLDKYSVGDDLLREQLVPTDRSLMTAERYEDFLELRARLLTDAANDYYARLRTSRSSVRPKERIEV